VAKRVALEGARVEVLSAVGRSNGFCEVVGDCPVDPDAPGRVDVVSGDVGTTAVFERPSDRL
jgi:hypothetical protein